MSGGFNAWRTQVGGSAGAVTAIGPVGAAPNANGGVISSGTLTLEPADGTHPGVIAGSGSQTLAPAMTLSAGLNVPQGQTITWGTANLGTLSNTGLPKITLAGGSTQLFFSGGNDQIQIASGQALSLSINDPGVFLIKFDTTAVKSVNFVSNVGNTIPSTLTPSGTTQTIDWATGTCQALSLASASGNVTLTLSNPVSGARYTIKITQGAVARNLVWPAAVKWPAGAAPVITVTNGAVDKIELFCDGTNYYGTFAQAFA